MAGLGVALMQPNDAQACRQFCTEILQTFRHWGPAEQRMLFEQLPLAFQRLYFWFALSNPGLEESLLRTLHPEGPLMLHLATWQSPAFVFPLQQLPPRALRSALLSLGMGSKSYGYGFAGAGGEIGVGNGRSGLRGRTAGDEDLGSCWFGLLGRERVALAPSGDVEGVALTALEYSLTCLINFLVSGQPLYLDPRARGAGSSAGVLPGSQGAGAMRGPAGAYGSGPPGGAGVGGAWPPPGSSTGGFGAGAGAGAGGVGGVTVAAKAAMALSRLRGGGGGAAGDSGAGAVLGVNSVNDNSFSLADSRPGDGVLFDQERRPASRASATSAAAQPSMGGLLRANSEWQALSGSVSMDNLGQDAHASRRATATSAAQATPAEGGTSKRPTTTGEGAVRKATFAQHTSAAEMDLVRPGRRSTVASITTPPPPVQAPPPPRASLATAASMRASLAKPAAAPTTETPRATLRVESEASRASLRQAAVLEPARAVPTPETPRTTLRAEPEASRASLRQAAAVESVRAMPTPETPRTALRVESEASRASLRQAAAVESARASLRPREEADAGTALLQRASATQSSRASLRAPVQAQASTAVSPASAPAQAQTARASSSAGASARVSMRVPEVAAEENPRPSIWKPGIILGVHDEAPPFIPDSVSYEDMQRLHQRDQEPVGTDPVELGHKVGKQRVSQRMEHKDGPAAALRPQLLSTS
eukprot:TRINITY_DN538_c0_g1_i2.p1 TRINITY_DN538_c0_g1~~TRINITY_DN538_c0_g1_i2.p1  ORF type:complete len:708 (-),score=141.02 TRINITY_DN538_c0_g1_i2:49-2172(-)